jgi:uncharacterized coiled-coil protein SlyX
MKHTMQNNEQTCSELKDQLRIITQQLSKKENSNQAIVDTDEEVKRCNKKRCRRIVTKRFRSGKWHQQCSSCVGYSQQKLSKLEEKYEQTFSELKDQIRIIAQQLSQIDNCKQAIVYFIRRVGTPEVKVGFSRDPTFRLRRLQCGNACDLRIEYEVPTYRYRILERRLHAHLKAQGVHIRGEWFTIPAGTDYGSIVDDAIGDHEDAGSADNKRRRHATNS